MFITLSEKTAQSGAKHSTGAVEASGFLGAAGTHCLPLEVWEERADLIWGNSPHFSGALAFSIYPGSGPALRIAKGKSGWFLPQSDKFSFSQGDGQTLLKIQL